MKKTLCIQDNTHNMKKTLCIPDNTHNMKKTLCIQDNTHNMKKTLCIQDNTHYTDLLCMPGIESDNYSSQPHISADVKYDKLF